MEATWMFTNRGMDKEDTINIYGGIFSSVQSLSCVQLFVIPWIAARQASLSITNSRSLLKLMPIESVMPTSHLILCHPLLLPQISPSIRVFSNESTLCMRWPKYGSFSFSISPSNEHPGLISFRMDWLDLLVVQGTLKSLLQHHSSKYSVIKKNEIMSFAAMWKDLGIIILSEVKDKYMILFIYGILNKWYKWTYLQSRNRIQM